MTTPVRLMSLATTRQEYPAKSWETFPRHIVYRESMGKVTRKQTNESQNGKPIDGIKTVLDETINRDRKDPPTEGLPGAPPIMLEKSSTTSE